MISALHWSVLALLAPGAVGLVAFADLLQPMSGAQVRATMVSTLKTLGVPADQWRAGGTYSTILTIVAYAIATFLGLVAQGLGAGFLETASGGWLTLLAYYVYGVSRPAATLATGNLTLTNSGGGIYSYGTQQATFGNSTTGTQYVNSAPFTLGANSSITIPIQATVPGSASSATPGQIDTLVTAMLGVTCGNAAAVLGSDAMGDPQLRQLCIAALGAMSVRGPRSAYAYAIQVAKNAVTGTPVNINRWYISTASHTGDVNVWLASPSGAPDANDVTGVETSIEQNARPDGITVNVFSATPTPYTASVNVWCASRPGLRKQVVEAAVEEALANYFETYPIGGFAKEAFYIWGDVLLTESAGIFASGVDGAIRTADPGIFAVDGTFDMTLAAGQVATDNVTVSVFLVSAPGST